MKIAYKIVNRCKEDNSNDRISLFVRGEFCIQYIKDEIKETKDTLGFFCFFDRDKAINYILNYFGNDKNWNRVFKIIRVELLENFIIPDKISSGIKEESIKTFYVCNKEFGTSFIPFGTICCKKIRVLS
jgi:hypothetical protein